MVLGWIATPLPAGTRSCPGQPLKKKKNETKQNKTLTGGREVFSRMFFKVLLSRVSCSGEKKISQPKDLPQHYLNSMQELHSLNLNSASLELPDLSTQEVSVDLFISLG